MSIIEITSVEQFNDIVSNNRVLVDFYAEWCGPCKGMAPELDKLDQAEPDLTIVKVNIETMEDIAIKHRIRAVPTLVLYENAQATKTAAGAKSLNQLKEFVNG